MVRRCSHASGGWLQGRGVGVGVGDGPGLEFWSWLDGVRLSFDYWVLDLIK